MMIVDLLCVSSTVVLCDRFEHVPLVTPNGDVLVKELNFEVGILRDVLLPFPRASPTHSHCGSLSYVHQLPNREYCIGWPSVCHESKLFLPLASYL